MDWFRRREVRRNFLCTQYRRYARDRRWCICEIRSNYNSDRVLALSIDETGVEFILSVHRTVAAAQRAIEKKHSRKRKRTRR